MSSTSDMVLLQHVHPSSRANCHPSFEYPSTVAIDRPFYSHHLDFSRLSPINDHPVNTNHKLGPLAAYHRQHHQRSSCQHKLGPLAYHRQHHQQISRLRSPSATDSDLHTSDFGGCYQPHDHVRNLNQTASSPTIHNLPPPHYCLPAQHRSLQ
eukprot:592049_1